MGFNVRTTTTITTTTTLQHLEEQLRRRIVVALILLAPADEAAAPPGRSGEPDDLLLRPRALRQRLQGEVADDPLHKAAIVGVQTGLGLGLGVAESWLSTRRRSNRGRRLRLVRWLGERRERREDFFPLAGSNACSSAFLRSHVAARGHPRASGSSDLSRRQAKAATERRQQRFPPACGRSALYSRASDSSDSTTHVEKASLT